MSVRQFIETALKTADVVVFSKTTCPYCVNAINGINAQTKSVHVVQLDTMPNGRDIQDMLLEITKQRTVPNVFVKGQHLGGCDNTLAAISSGQFQSMMQA